MTLRHDRVLVIPPGELFAPRTEKQRERDRENRERLAEIRWRGRFTFKGHRALRDLAARTGCSFPVIERFVMSAKVNAENARKLTAACKVLKLEVDELRAMRPSR